MGCFAMPQHHQNSSCQSLTLFMPLLSTLTPPTTKKVSPMTDNPTSDNPTDHSKTNLDYSFDPLPDEPYAYGFELVESDSADTDTPETVAVALRTREDVFNWVNTQRADNKPDEIRINNPIRPERIAEFVHELIMNYGITACMEDLATLIKRDKLTQLEAENAITAWHNLTKESLDQIIGVFYHYVEKGSTSD